MRESYIQITEESKNKPILSIHYEPTRTMDYNTFCQVINALPKGIDEIHITGGDPLVVSSLARYLTLASKKAKIILHTPCSVSPEALNSIKQLISKVVVQLKYPDENLHDEWNKNAKAYSHLIKALEWCQSNKMPHTVHFEVDTQNYNYLLRVIKLCKNYGSSLHLSRTLPLTKEIGPLFLISSVWNAVCYDAEHSGLIVTVDTDKNNVQSCSAGVGQFNVFPDGSISMSSNSAVILGNIVYESWPILKDRLMKERLKYSKCSSCPCIVEKKRNLFPLEKIDEAMAW